MGAVFDLLEQVFPIEVYWRLTIADQANAAFHQGFDIEMIYLSELARQRTGSPRNSQNRRRRR